MRMIFVAVPGLFSWGVAQEQRQHVPISCVFEVLNVFMTDPLTFYFAKLSGAQPLAVVVLDHQ